MAEAKRSYNLYAQMSKMFFSYKKPGDGKAYTSMYVQNYDGMITLRFTKQVTSENRTELNCYLPSGKLWALSRILEGMMARRRDDFEKGQHYDPSESWTIPTTAFRNGEEAATGKLTVDTEMYDGIPKLRLTYTDFEKDQSVEFVFNSRVPSGEITGTTLDFKLDYADIDAFNFVNTLAKVVDPMADIIYRVSNSLANDLKRYISGCFRNSGGGKPSGSYAPKSSYSNDESYDAF